jgi:hypothetical protein
LRPPRRPERQQRRRDRQANQQPLGLLGARRRNEQQAETDGSDDRAERVGRIDAAD